MTLQQIPEKRFATEPVTSPNIAVLSLTDSPYADCASLANSFSGEVAKSRLISC